MAGGNRAEQAALRRKHKLPYRCECGGVMKYDHSLGRVWSWCTKCSPVQKVTIKRHALR